MRWRRGDLANNYGPPPGSAEENFGRIFHDDFRAYRDELVLSTKAGYTMWEGPYGDWGSRKYLLSSLDQSLKRMGVDYVDIFYSHRPDPKTPVEETMSALVSAVHSGKALYAGISNYNPEQTAKAVGILREMGTPCLIHQMKYSIFQRTPEQGVLDALGKEGVGGIAFSPLAQGLLSDRYTHGIPADSRANRPAGFLRPKEITEERLTQIRGLAEIASRRAQTLAQMALAWVLRDMRITSVLIGASKVEQIDQNVAALKNLAFTEEELSRIDSIGGST
jgi:L-glyceraldehyde 3-phosphate reductase